MLRRLLFPLLDSSPDPLMCDNVNRDYMEKRPHTDVCSVYHLLYGIFIAQRTRPLYLESRLRDAKNNLYYQHPILIIWSFPD